MLILSEKEVQGLIAIDELIVALQQAHIQYSAGNAVMPVRLVVALPQILDWIDAENARRAKAHKRPIRIVQAPALSVEQLPRGLGAWISGATALPRALPAAIASVLP